MTRQTADIFSLRETHSIVIPTNMQGIMGNGLARQLVEVDPDSARFYTETCASKDWLYRPSLPFTGGWIFFPTKKTPQEASTIDIIERACQRLLGTLRLWADQEPVALPAVGCGLGGLSLDEVLPVLDYYLRGDRFTLVEPRLFAVLDTETTGLSNDDKVIEVGIALATHDGVKPGRCVETYTALQDPGFPIPWAATRVNGITDSMVRGRRIDWARVDSMLNRAEFVVAHNAAFDSRFVATEKKWLCSQRGIDWEGRGYTTTRLQALLEKHQVATDSKHRALGDALALLNLLRIGDYFSMLTSSLNVLQNSTHGNLRQSHSLFDLEANRGYSHNA